MSQALSGDLAQMRLSDVVKFLGSISASGRVSIVCDEKGGELFFDEGRMVHAVSEDIEGMDAIQEVVSWGGGRFDFSPGEAAPKSTIELDSEALLSDLDKRQEEFRRQCRQDAV